MCRPWAQVCEEEGQRHRLENCPEGAAEQQCPAGTGAGWGAGSWACWLAQHFPELWAVGGILPSRDSMRCPGVGHAESKETSHLTGTACCAATLMCPVNLRQG